MTTRISTNHLINTGLQGILKHQNDISNIMNEISSGKKSNIDPVQQVEANDYSTTISNKSQYIRNAETIQPWIEQQDKDLSNINNNLIKIKEIAIAINNPSVNNDDKKNYQQEYNAAKQNIIDTLNSKDAFGEYMYSGNSSRIQPFQNNSITQYHGDNGVRFIDIDQNVQVGVNITGNNIADNNMITSFQKLDNIFNNNTTFDNSLLDDLNLSINNISQQQTKVGLNLQKIDNYKDILDNLNLTYKNRLSNIQDTDMNEAISNLSKTKNALDAMYQTQSTIQKLTLFNYL